MSTCNDDANKPLLLIHVNSSFCVCAGVTINTTLCDSVCVCETLILYDVNQLRCPPQSHAGYQSVSLDSH